MIYIFPLLLHNIFVKNSYKCSNTFVSNCSFNNIFLIKMLIASMNRSEWNNQHDTLKIFFQKKNQFVRQGVQWCAILAINLSTPRPRQSYLKLLKFSQWNAALLLSITADVIRSKELQMPLTSDNLCFFEIIASFVPTTLHLYEWYWLDLKRFSSFMKDIG